MSMQLLKPTGLHVMTSRTDTAVKKNGGIPWYGFFAGGVIYTILAVVLFAESTSSVLAWISAICAPGGVTLPGLLGIEKNETMMVANHALQRTRPLRCGYNPPPRGPSR
jgi:hypothetical protein